MDPATAAGAFVGFAASLAALTGLALNGLQTLSRFVDKTKTAPKSLLRLQGDLKRLEVILSEIKRQLNDELTTLPQDVDEVWTNAASEMQEDLESFGKFLLKFERPIYKVSTSSRNFKMGAKLFFNEARVEEFKRMFSKHLKFLQTVQLFLYYRTLSSITITTERIEYLVTESGLEDSCSRLRDIGLASQNHLELQQQILDQVHSMNHILQHSLGTVSGQRSLKFDQTHRNIKRLQGPVQSSRHYRYNLLIGYLDITVTKQLEQNTERKTKESTKAWIMFIPPRLVSNIAFQGRFGVHRTSLGSCPELTATLSPTFVNQNTTLLEAVTSLDVTTLRELFASGQAQPTDHIISSYGLIHIYKEPMSLVDNILLMFLSRIPCSRRLLQHQAFLDFLLEQGSLASSNAVIGFFKRYNEDWAYDRPEISNGLCSGYFKSLSSSDEYALNATTVPKRFLEYNCGVDLDETQSSLLSVLVAGHMGFDDIPYCLDRHGHSWVLEDLFLIDKWLIGILAFTDDGFCRSLKTHLRGFRSDFGTSQQLWVQYAFENHFGMAAVKSQVIVASKDDRASFLTTIVQKGTFAMLEPFLDLGRQLKEACERINLLGLAASKADIAKIDGLVDAGLDGALALPYFLRESGSISQLEFECVLSKLLAHAPGVHHTLWQFPDPLFQVLESDRAYTINPELVKTLLEGGYYNLGSIHGSLKIHPCNSQIIVAIENNRSEALALFLEQGIDINAKIGDLFACYTDHTQQLKLCSWLTFAVHHGRPQCVKILLEHGAEIEALDGSGSTAIEIGRRYTSGKYPRPHPFRPSEWRYKNISLSLDQDLEILTILEEALTKISNRSGLQLNGDSSSDVIARTEMKRRIFEALSGFRNCFQERCLYRTTLHIMNFVWHVSRLSYVEHLMMLLGFLAAYTMLLLFEVFSIICWAKISLSELPHVSCIFVLSLVIVSVSLTNSWGLIS